MGCDISLDTRAHNRCGGLFNRQADGRDLYSKTGDRLCLVGGHSGGSDRCAHLSLLPKTKRRWE